MDTKVVDRIKEKQFANFVSLRYCGVVPILCIIIIPFWNYRTITKIPKVKLAMKSVDSVEKQKKSTNSTL